MYHYFSGLWGNLKARICTGRGLYHENIQVFLDEFSYRHLYSNDGDIFSQLLKDCKVKS